MGKYTSYIEVENAIRVMAQQAANSSDRLYRMRLKRKWRYIRLMSTQEWERAKPNTLIFRRPNTLQMEKR